MSTRPSLDDVTPATVAAVRRTLDGRWHTVRDEIRARDDFADLAWSGLSRTVAPPAATSAS